MASHHEHTYIVNTDDEEEDDDYEIVEEEEEEEDESTLSHHEGNKTHEPCSYGGGRDDRNNKVGLGLFFSRNKFINPKAQWVQEWNRVFLLVCAIGLFVDPLFFYAISISESCMCLFVDGWFAVAVTVFRCMADGLHVWNMWLQFKMMRNRTTNMPYLKAKKGFLFDIFVILPLPQVSSNFFY